MKSICVQLKEEKYKDYFFYLFINELNILHSFICYKMDKDIVDYVLYDVNNFSENELTEIQQLLYEPQSFNVFNDFHPYQILINRSKKEKINNNFNLFRNSNLFSNKNRYTLLYSGEVFHELFFLVLDKEIKETILVLTESVNGFKIIKNVKFINELPVEEIALIISMIIPRLKEKETDFIVHLSNNVEILLYKEDNYGYAFIVNKDKFFSDEKTTSVRSLYFNIINDNESKILYQDEFNQSTISKLRVISKNILANSKFYKKSKI